LSNIGTNTHAQIDSHISATNNPHSTSFSNLSGNASDVISAGTNISWSGDTLNVDDAFLKNDADDTTSYKITAGNFAVTSDNNTNDTAYVPMVLHGTDATPPTASNFPRGTIYIQYTA